MSSHFISKSNGDPDITRWNLFFKNVYRNEFLYGWNNRRLVCCLFRGFLLNFIPPFLLLGGSSLSKRITSSPQCWSLQLLIAKPHRAAELPPTRKPAPERRITLTLPLLRMMVCSLPGSPACPRKAPRSAHFLGEDKSTSPVTFFPLQTS